MRWDGVVSGGMYATAVSVSVFGCQVAGVVG